MPDSLHDKPGPIPGLTEEQSEKVREGWRQKDRRDYAESFDKAWQQVSTAIERLKTDPVAAKLKMFRDKYHSHLEIAPLGQDPGPFDVSALGLTFNDLLEFSDSYMESVIELTRILTGAVYDLEGFSSVHKRYGSEMWRILAGLAPKAKGRV